jgi:hypothetical protein
MSGEILPGDSFANDWDNLAKQMDELLPDPSTLTWEELAEKYDPIINDPNRDHTLPNDVNVCGPVTKFISEKGMAEAHRIENFGGIYKFRFLASVTKAHYFRRVRR